MGKVSVTAYAKHRGRSRQAIYDAIRAGRIEQEPDKTIDQEKADRQWTELTGRSRGNGKPKRKPAAAARPPPGGEDDLPSLPDLADAQPVLPASLRQRQEVARTQKMEAEAREADLDACERVGELVNRSLAREEVFRWFRQERDAWRGFPARFSAQIAAELQEQGATHRAVNAVLEKYVDQFLEERGDVERPDFEGSTE